MLGLDVGNAGQHARSGYALASRTFWWFLVSDVLSWFRLHLARGKLCMFVAPPPAGLTCPRLQVVQSYSGCAAFCPMHKLFSGVQTHCFYLLKYLLPVYAEA